MILKSENVQWVPVPVVLSWKESPVTKLATDKKNKKQKKTTTKNCKICTENIFSRPVQLVL